MPADKKVIKTNIACILFTNTLIISILILISEMHASNIILFLTYAIVARAQEFIISNNGKLDFYDDTKRIYYHIELKPYFDNMNNIQNAMNKLNDMCNELGTLTKCENYKQNYKEDLKSMLSTNQYFRQMGNRKKRAIKSSKYLVSALIGATVGETTWSVADDIKTNRLVDVLTKNEIITLHKSLLETQSNLTKMHNKMSSKFEEFQELMLSLTLMKIDYTFFTMRYIEILENKWHRHIFDILDYDEFTYLLHNAKMNLTEEQTLPDIDLNNLYSLCKLHADKNTTHITIAINVPVISAVKSHFLWEIVPIPFSNENNTKILNMNSILITNMTKNDIKIVPENVFRTCKHVQNITLCNSISQLSLLNSTKCINNILDNGTEHCNTKQIDHKNYLTHISQHDMFWYVVSPMQIRIVCNDSTKQFEIVKNARMHLKGHCDVFFTMNNTTNATESTSINLTQEYLSEDVLNYSDIHKNWDKTIESIDKQNIILLREVDLIENNTLYSKFSNAIGWLTQCFQMLPTIFQVFLLTFAPVYICFCLLRMCIKE